MLLGRGGFIEGTVWSLVPDGEIVHAGNSSKNRGPIRPKVSVIRIVGSPHKRSWGGAKRSGRQGQTGRTDSAAHAAPQPRADGDDGDDGKVQDEDKHGGAQGGSPGGAGGRPEAGEGGEQVLGPRGGRGGRGKPARRDVLGRVVRAVVRGG